MNRNIITIVAAIAIVVILGLGWYYYAPQVGGNKTNTEKVEGMDNMNQDEDDSALGSAPMLPERNIIRNATNAENLTSFVSALQSTELAVALQSESAAPFTVFAPSDMAFEKLPENTLETLFRDENKERLTEILEHHVITGGVVLSGIESEKTFETLDGKTLTISVDDDGNYWLGGEAMVISEAIRSSNGVFYVIDTVLIPEVSGA